MFSPPPIHLPNFKAIRLFLFELERLQRCLCRGYIYDQLNVNGSWYQTPNQQGSSSPHPQGPYQISKQSDYPFLSQSVYKKSMRRTRTRTARKTIVSPFGGYNKTIIKTRLTRRATTRRTLVVRYNVSPTTVQSIYFGVRTRTRMYPRNNSPFPVVQPSGLRSV